MSVVYAKQITNPLREAPSGAARIETTVLMGAWLKVLETDGPWRRVRTRPRKRRGETVQFEGWIHDDSVQSERALKIWFVDVGQGDGSVVESPQGVVVIDGGPNRALYDFIERRARPILQEEGTLHIDALVNTHPDDDHFVGLTQLLKDPNFTFGWIYHNGIARYYTSAGKDHRLGRFRARTVDGRDIEALTETFDSIEDARTLIATPGVMARFKNLWTAAVEAFDAGRLKGARRLTSRWDTLPGFSGSAQDGLRIEVLGPVPTQSSGRIEYEGFAAPEEGSDEISTSHTVNGHSIVLKLLFGDHVFLFGGDLNIPAQLHLRRHYAGEDPPIFRADVAKACHHGSSDFLVDFLKDVQPRVNVFSSGEERQHDHPMPDALGAASRYTRGRIPLLFSTELARSEFSSGRHTGQINARSNGSQLVMAQLKEKGGQNPWHSFEVPFEGKFPDT